MDSASFDLYAAVAGHHDLLTVEEERRLSTLVRAGAEAQIRLAAERPDKSLRRVVEEGIEARNRLVINNQRLVLKHARRFAGDRVDLLDLVQEGNLALLRAAEKFDGRKGFKFSTYADSWIAAYMAICSAETRSAIRIPKQVYSTIETVRAATDRLTVSLKRLPTVEEVSVESGLSVHDVNRARGLAAVVSLDVDGVEDQSTAARDFIADVHADDPTDLAVGACEMDEVRCAVAALPDDLRLVVSMRHGLAGEEPRSKSSLARELGLSAHAVTRLEEAGLGRLAEAIGGLPRVS